MKVNTIAEIGINHNGSVEITKKLIDAACIAGFDYVKFQKIPMSLRMLQTLDYYNLLIND